jgi:GNAT superfamily N-acetyltransferase
MESLVLKPMDGSFLLWRCLHDGPVTRKNLDLPPDDSRLPFQDTAIPLLTKLTELYGSAAILAWEGEKVVGLLRFVPRVVSQMEGGGGFLVTCMQLLSDWQRKGVGRAMVEWLKSWAREEGWNAIEATAYQDLPLVYEITGNAGRSWWEGLGFQVRESLEEEVMKEYPDFLHTLETQAREEGMDPREVTQKFIMRWEI